MKKFILGAILAIALCCLVTTEAGARSYRSGYYRGPRYRSYAPRYRYYTPRYSYPRYSYRPYRWYGRAYYYPRYSYSYPRYYYTYPRYYYASYPAPYYWGVPYYGYGYGGCVTVWW